MKIKLLVAAAATVVASSAMAQSAFEGFYGQVGTGYESNTVTNLSSPYTVTTNSATYTGTSSAGNQTASGMPLVLGIGYTFAVTGPWLVGLGADYSALSQKTGSFTTTQAQNGGGSSTATGNQIELSNRYNIFVTPSYAISKAKLAYVKVGYSSVQSKFTSPAQSTDPSFSTTVNNSGYILGLGYKQMIAGGLYGFAEGNYMSYSKTSSNVSWRSTDNSYTTSVNQTGASNAYTLLVGVGYKF
jgi:hypothetical protein